MRIAFFTGADNVTRVAGAMRLSRVPVLCEGEERVYVDAPGETVREARAWVIEHLREHVGQTFDLEFGPQFG